MSLYVLTRDLVRGWNCKWFWCTCDKAVTDCEVAPKSGKATVLVCQVFRDIRTNLYRVQQVDTLYSEHDFKSLQNHLTSRKHIVNDLFLDTCSSGKLQQHKRIVGEITAFWKDESDQGSGIR